MEHVVRVYLLGLRTSTSPTVVAAGRCACRRSGAGRCALRAFDPIQVHRVGKGASRRAHHLVRDAAVGTLSLCQQVATARQIHCCIAAEQISHFVATNLMMTLPSRPIGSCLDAPTRRVNTPTRGAGESRDCRRFSLPHRCGVFGRRPRSKRHDRTVGLCSFCRPVEAAASDIHRSTPLARAPGQNRSRILWAVLQREVRRGRRQGARESAYPLLRADSTRERCR
jgi:hypothetical protein